MSRVLSKSWKIQFDWTLIWSGVIHKSIKWAMHKLQKNNLLISKSSVIRKLLNHFLNTGKQRIWNNEEIKKLCH